MKLSMRRAAVTQALVILVFFLFSSASALAAKADLRAGQISVMTQNLYIGAEILGIAEATGICELMSATDGAVQQILANDFSQRATAIADIILAEQPHVIGIQEAFTVVHGGIEQNYLNMLMAELGDNYYIAAVRDSVPVPDPPIPGIPADMDDDCEPANWQAAIDYFASIKDHDAILCRLDVQCGFAQTGNYAINATTQTPAGEIVIERGWVSVVASVKDRAYRIVNTHLEVNVNALFRTVQYAQALELALWLDGFSATDGLPQLVIGDFNSEASPGPTICYDPEDEKVFECLSSYEILTVAGYIDTWLSRGGPADEGLTCCQAEDLLNADSWLSERLDQVWVRPASGHYGGPVVRGVRADVLGASQKDRSNPDGLWPSDHAGVIARVVLRSPR